MHAGLLTGKPPKRWAHVYTGNTAPAAGMFQPALPPLPAVPSTPLARVLTGIDEFVDAPRATAFLLSDLPGSDSARDAEAAAIAEHRQLMLGEMLGALRRRLRRLASGLEAERLAAAASEGADYALRVAELAADATYAVPRAAQAAMRDAALAPARKRRREREAFRV